MSQRGDSCTKAWRLGANIGETGRRADATSGIGGHALLSFTGAIRRLGTLALSFVGILMLLIAGHAVQKRYPDPMAEVVAAWEDAEAAPAQIATLKTTVPRISHDIDELGQRLENDLAAADGLADAAIGQRIQVLRVEEERVEGQKLTAGRLATAALSGQNQKLVDHYLSPPRLAAIAVERDTLKAVKEARLLSVTQRRDREAFLTKELDQSKREVDEADAELRRLDAGVWRDPRNKICASIPPNVAWTCQTFRKIEEWQDKKAKAVRRNKDAAQEYKRLLMTAAVVEPVQSDLAAFRRASDQTEISLQDQIAQLENLSSQNLVRRVRDHVDPVLGQAVTIMLSIMLLPVAIRLFHYYLVAPLAARCRPIVVLPNGGGAISGQHNPAAPYEQRSPAEGVAISAVTQRLAVDPGHDLLARPEWIQSIPATAESRTQWLLDWRMPLSSLAAGMVGLTRVRCCTPEYVAISSANDPFNEVGVVELAAGSSIVLQPRSLIGILTPRGQPPRVTRHLRLGHLNAWLTLQLRFIVFHGPCTLVVHGRRGVCLEPAGSGRLLGRDQTMGFSANLAYASRRTETFFPYLVGAKPLLKDSFTGSGYLLYEELPRDLSRKSFIGRNVEGLWDAGLKLFGV